VAVVAVRPVLQHQPEAPLQVTVVVTVVLVVQLQLQLTAEAAEALEDTPVMEEQVPQVTHLQLRMLRQVLEVEVAVAAVAVQLTQQVPVVVLEFTVKVLVVVVVETVPMTVVVVLAVLVVEMVILQPPQTLVIFTQQEINQHLDYMVVVVLELILQVQKMPQALAAQFVLYGEQVVHSHQLIQEMYNGIVH
jgi:hypothetical protein